MENLEKTVVLRAKEIIQKPENWTKGVAARDVAGNRIWVSSDKAVCYCMIGAIRKAQLELDPAHQIDPGDESFQKIKKILVSIIPKNFEHPANFNDKSSHEEVLEVLRKTAEQL